MAASVRNVTYEVGSSGVTSDTITIPATASGSALLVIIGQIAGSTQIVPTIGDSGLTSPNQATWVNPSSLGTQTDGPPPSDYQSGSNTSVCCAYALNVPAGIVEIDISWASASKGYDVRVIEIAGVSSMRASVHGGGGTAAVSQTPPSIASVAIGDFVVFAEQAPASASPTGSAGYTMANESEGGNNWLGVAYQVAGTAGTYSVTFNNAISVKAGMIGLTFSASGAGGSVPVNTAAPTISGTPTAGQTLSVSTGTWTNTPTSYLYQWYYFDGTSYAAISGATGASYTVKGTDVYDGRQIVASVTGVNANGAGAATYASNPQTTSWAAGSPPAINAGTDSTKAVGGTWPTAAGVSGTPNYITVATVPTWLNSPTTYRYRTERSIDGGVSWATVAETAGATYTITGADVGSLLRMSQIAFNNAGYTVATSTNSVGPIVAVPFYSNKTFRPWDFQLQATFAGQFVDISQYLRGRVSIRRGRNNRLDRSEAGTMSFTLDNTDRSFEPEYAGGQFYPNVVPMVPVALYFYTQLPDGTIKSHVIFFGLIPDWPMNFQTVKRTTSDLTAVDFFGVLAAQKMRSNTFASNKTGTVIASILAQSTLPVASESIDAGKETAVSTTWTNVDLLSAAQDLADTENGLIVGLADGTIAFHDRDHRITNARSTTTQAIFGDDPTQGELPYLDADVEYGVSRIYNDVQITSGIASPTMTPQTDATSQSKYGQRTFTRSTYLSTDAAANAQGQRILGQNKDPHVRFPQIVVDPLRQAGLLEAILNLEISDLVVVNRRPYTGGAVMTKACWIEGVQHDITMNPFSWRTTFTLSLAQSYGGSGPSQYWLLDPTSGSDSLDSTTVLR